MRALVNTENRPGAVELQDRPTPEIGPEDVLIRVEAVGVCGSDLHQWHGTHSWPVNYPVALGHEFGGVIERVGENVAGFHPGDRVVSETAARTCGSCIYCRSGNYNLCPHRLGFGYGVDGAMADYVRAPAIRLHHVPDSVPMEDAAMTEPACVAANAVIELSHVQPGDLVVVIGPGPIGQMALQMARLGSPGGLWMVGTERDTARLEMARMLGASEILVDRKDDPLSRVQQVGDGLGAHLVVDCVGISATLKTSLDLVRPGGQITKIGWGRAPVGFSLDPLVQKAARLQGSFSHTWTTWERVLGLFARGQVQTAPIRRVFSLDQWETAFHTMDRLEIAKSILAPQLSMPVSEPAK